MPSVTIATTTAIMPHPSPTMSLSISCRPSSAIPTRRSFFEENVSPGRIVAGSCTVLAATAPSTIAISSGLTVGSRRPTPIATAVATAATATPGISEAAAARARPGASGAVVCCSTLLLMASRFRH